MQSITLITDSPKETRRLGVHIGRLAQGNDIYLLTGKLGAGKTHLVQGIAFGLGVKEYACSPSFMIAREYQGRLALYHLDLYRLDHIGEIIDLGLDEYFKDDAVCAIEWAEKGSGLLPRHNLTIELEHLPGDRRKFTFVPLGARYIKLAAQLMDTLKKDNGEKWNFL